MDGARRRMGLAVLAAAALVLYFVLAPAAPVHQTVHLVLGDAAPRVEEVRVRYAPGKAGKPDKNAAENDEDWTREAAFRFPDGGAPRIVTHEPHLADGDYVVEIDLTTLTLQHETARTHVALTGSPTSIDVSEAVPK